MADIYPSLVNEWMTLIHSTWPEITLPGSGANSNFFTSLQALRRNIIETMADGSFGVAAPWAILRIGDFIPTQWGLDTQDRFARIEVYYIAAEKDGATQTTVNAKLYSLIEAVDRPTVNHTYFFSPDPGGRIDSSDESPVNAILAVESQVRLVGAVGVWDPGVLVNIG